MLYFDHLNVNLFGINTLFFVNVARMCQLSSIKLFVQVFIWIKLVVALYIFGIGITIASSTDLNQGFGVEYLDHGVSLVFLALVSGGVIYPQQYAVKKHNRFLLVFSFVMDTIVFANLINIGSMMSESTIPQFSKELQADCLRHIPEIYSQDECSPFYKADRTAGFRLVWAYYFSGKSDKDKNQVLSKIQGQGCCGFFQPLRCIANDAKFPDDFDTTGIKKRFLKSRVTCGEFSGYYQEQDNCINFVDFAQDPPLVGGCNYDLGVGFCLDVEVLGKNSGCASEVEDYLVSLIASHAVLLMGVSVFNLMFMTVACCQWWKRKEADIFPTFTEENRVR